MTERDALSRFHHSLSHDEQREVEESKVYEEFRARRMARTITEEYEAFIRSKGRCVPNMPKVDKWIQ